MLELFYDGEPAMDLLDSAVGTDLFCALLDQAEAACRARGDDLL